MLDESELNHIVEMLEAGETEHALHHLESLEKEGSDEDRLAIADLYLELGLADRAVNVLAALYVDYAGNPHVALSLAEAYLDSDREEEAIAVLEKVDTKDREAHVRSLVLLADLYQSQGLDEVAVKKLLEALETNPDEPLLIYGLAELYASIGSFEQAVPLYARLPHLALPEEIDYQADYAEALTMIGSFEEALVEFEKSTGRNLNTVFGHAMTAHRIGRDEVAVKQFEELRTMDPDFTSLYLPYTEALEALGRIDEALEMISHGIERDDYNDELRTVKAKLFLRQGATDEAVNELREALALNPESLEATELLLSVLFEAGDMDAVIETIDALEDHSTSPLMTWYKAKAAYELEAYEDAVVLYESIEDVYKEDVSFATEWATLLVEEGQRDKAKRTLEQTLALTVDVDDRQALEERLDSLADRD
ncbi:tetratricopeptide repeat protein [Exiguobacterium alkaliphilum]|uniref:tetratricopeptide repeat protein n=1 Tax=Exiguobacterium alkaliphilum TaxID=1428684 RepID=UPI001BA86115|nr:tetratricopeptide repeat protein [Exiguobacterium alkaliphilum]QUE85573.1 tetratricopeptide repeat protein [Exiguobacterium alkaliphilum]